MQIIADSGSTKTAWRIVDQDGNISQEKTAGLNPYYLGKEKMIEMLNESFLVKYQNQNIKVFFYGSGLASPSSAQILKDVLQIILPLASIEISDDLTAAARATCGNQPGIANILGTGSNSCYYDGNNIVHNIPSAGYILGDEGSGSYMGRILLGDFIRKNLPENLSEKLENRFGLNRDIILENVYRQPQANKYLAQFGKFIFQNLKHPYCSELVMNSFDLFFKNYISKYRDYKILPVHFIGSIAFYFSDYLRKTASKYEVQIGKIIENPIAGLTLYHKELNNDND